MNVNEQIIAKPGYALVGMKPRYGDEEGQIVIPGIAQAKRPNGRLGVVCSVNPYPENQLNAVFEKGVKVARPAYLMNEYYTTLLGKWVVCRNAVLCWGQLYSVRLEFIESTGCEQMEPSEAEVGRCFQCKSEGEANILLGPDGYCPICGMNQDGEHINDFNLRDSVMNDRELVDNVVRIPAEEHHRRHNGGGVKGQIISFAGQKNRSGIVQARIAPNILRILK